MYYEVIFTMHPFFIIISEKLQFDYVISRRDSIKIL